MKRRWKIGLGVLLSGVVLALLAFLSFEVAIRIAASSLPEVVDNQTYQENIWQVSRIYAADRTLLDQFSRQRRTVVPFKEISPALVDAVLAAEDRSFYQHTGVDWKAIARAIFRDVLARRFAQGGSTLTQQLARNLYLNHEKTLWRKFKEAVLARKIEEKLSKEDILFQYLNTIYWGHGSYGVEEASRYYFAKHASDLTTAEAALLAGIIRGPELYSPVKYPEKAKGKMEHVLEAMAECGTLSGSATDYEMPVVARRPEVEFELAPYAVDAAIVELRRRIDGPVSVDTGGYQVSTSISVPFQRSMNEAVRRYLGKVRPRIKTANSVNDAPDACVHNGVLRPGCPVWARVLSEDEERGGYLADLFGRLGWIPRDSLEVVEPYRPGGGVLKPGEWVKVIPLGEVLLASPWVTEEVLLQPLVEPQIAAVLLHAPTGAVLAVYGGVDHRYHPFNRAISAHRQVGSTIKPFLYLAAAEILGWEADTEVPIGSIDLPGAGGRKWRVRDTHRLKGTPTLTDALAHSSNTAAVRTLRKLQLAPFLEKWRQWGLPEIEGDNLSLALGNVEMSPMELAQCYSLLANYGACAPTPTLIWHIVDGMGNPVGEAPRFCLGEASRTAVDAVLPGLHAVVEEGTGRHASIPGLVVAGKTGTTTDGTDAWFAGIVSEHVLVVWVGSDDHEPIPGNSGPTTAAVLWKEIAMETFGAPQE